MISSFLDNISLKSFLLEGLVLLSFWTFQGGTVAMSPLCCWWDIEPSSRCRWIECRVIYRGDWRLSRRELNIKYWKLDYRSQILASNPPAWSCWSSRSFARALMYILVFLGDFLKLDRIGWWDVLVWRDLLELGGGMVELKYQAKSLNISSSDIKISR